jgi:riboflavin kinase/FMN adenylyltransferase
VVQPFTLEYAKTTAEQFERSVLDQLKAKQLVTGADFTYGSRRSGNIETLRQAALQRQASIQVVPPVTVDGVVVSSSKVREYLLEGRVGATFRLLGRYFDLDGAVVPGDGRGRTIGIPTANVDTANELKPAPGVYAVRARVKGGSPDWLAGAANIGVKPTFGGGAVTVEVHLLGFEGNLYGQELRVQFIDRLRSERRFASVSELVGQVKRDLEATREVIARAQS